MALCATSGGNYKRYRLSVRLAGVFDSRVIDYMHCTYNVVVVTVVGEINFNSIQHLHWEKVVFYV